MNRTIIIGTRGSRLALQQARIVADLLLAAYPGLQIQQKIIKTKGDAIMDIALSKIGDKGLFVKEIELALENKTIDIAVHSMKDLPTENPDDLIVAAIPPREDVRDVLISFNENKLNELREGAVIATSSLRRSAQLLAFRSDFQIRDIRGNVETRIHKFKSAESDGLILAAAGLKRLGMEEYITEYLSPDILLPAPSQGAIAVQVRKDDQDIIDLAGRINDDSSYRAAIAERSVLLALQGGCQTPIAAYGLVSGHSLHLRAKVLNPDGSKQVQAEIDGSHESAEKLGQDLAADLMEKGADQILEDIYAHR